MKQANYLLALDFDQTIANTFALSPHNLNVQKAYDLAVSDVFGPRGKRLYEAQEGLHNRSPLEVVHDLLHDDPNSHRLVNAAGRYLTENREKLIHLVPETKAVKLDLKDNPFNTMAELLVRAKLNHLLGEIGPDWPQPTEGFLEAWQYIKSLPNITTAIISSGHDLFIDKTLKTWGISLPDFSVTEDDIRNRRYPSEMGRRVKPGQLPLALAHRQWLNRTYDQWTLMDATESKQRMGYFGDDTNKDGQLALRGGIMFGLFNPNGINQTYGDGNLTFNNWLFVGQRLQNHRDLLHIGIPLKNIFSDSIHLEGNMSRRSKV